MKNLTARLIDAAAESFPMRGPIYEFTFMPACVADPRSRSRGSRRDPVDASTHIDRFDNLDRLPFPDGDAGTVICHGVLGHVFQPQRAIAEMTRILSPGGLLVVAESTWPVAPDGGQPYWTPHPSAISRLLGGLGGSLVGWIGPDAAPQAVFGMGCKSPLPAQFAQGVRPFLDRLDRALAETSPRLRVLRSLARRFAAWSCPAGGQWAWGDNHRVQFALHLPGDQQSSSAMVGSLLPQANTGTRLDLSD